MLWDLLESQASLLGTAVVDFVCDTGPPFPQCYFVYEAMCLCPPAAPGAACPAYRPWLSGKKNCQTYVKWFCQQMPVCSQGVCARWGRLMTTVMTTVSRLVKCHRWVHFSQCCKKKNLFVSLNLPLYPLLANVELFVFWKIQQLIIVTFGIVVHFLWFRASRFASIERSNSFGTLTIALDAHVPLCGLMNLPFKAPSGKVHIFGWGHERMLFN